MSSNGPKGWIRLGIMAEKSILLENRDAYHGLVIPAHVFALYRNAIGQFLRSIDKPYFIDPMSYVFLEDRAIIRRADGRTKKSYSKYAELSPQGRTLVDNEKPEIELLSPEDIRNLINTIVDLAIQSQLINASHRRGVDSLQRIRTARGQLNEIPNIPTPTFVTTPYFLLETIESENLVYQMWLRTIAQFIQKTRRIDSQIPVYTSVCIHPQILSDEPSLSRLLQDIGNPYGVVLWVDNLEKCGPTDESLEGLRTIINGVKERGTHEIISQYGGYFTAVYSSFGLDGLSYGLSSGDSRSVSTSATGGGAPSRYYDPNLHAFQSTTRYLRFLMSSLQHAQKFNCSCTTCSPLSEQVSIETSTTNLGSLFTQVFQQRGRSIAMDWFNERRHFLYNRQIELNHIGNTSVRDLGEEARRTIAEYEELGADDLNLRTLELVNRLSNMPQ